MASTKILILVVFLCLLQYSRAMDKLAEEKEVLDKILGDEHNNIIIRPPTVNGSDGPVIAETNMFVRSVSQIDDVKMEFQVQLTFRQKWRDPRLAYQDKHFKHTRYVTLLNPQNVWTPDVFFSNEKEAHFHNMLRPNILMRIFPDGEVLYSTRISLKLSCPMDLGNYPFDTQTCSVILASYGYTTDDLIFMWKPDTPVTLTKNVETSRYALTLFVTDYCTSKTSTGEYSCLKLSLHFAREWGYYLTQVYIPLAFMVILSWIPFWLDHRQTTARVVIWMGTLLVMALVTTTVQSKLPPFSTAKAIDVWCGVCYTFLFAVAIEFAVIGHFTFREDKNPLTNMDDHTDTNGQDSKLGKVGKWLKNYPSRVQRIDVISRICFPLAFIAFNVIYWASYGRRD